MGNIKIKMIVTHLYEKGAKDQEPGGQECWVAKDPQTKQDIGKSGYQDRMMMLKENEDLQAKVLA